MAKYKLTITDLESGEVKLEKTCDGIMGAIISQSTGNFSSPATFAFMLKLSPVDTLSLLIALDNYKEHFLATHPSIAHLYGMKDQLLRAHIAIDINELKKQAGAL